MYAVVKLLGGWRATAAVAAALLALAALGVQSWRLDSAHDALAKYRSDATAIFAAQAESLRLKNAEITELRREFKETEDEARADKERLLADLASGRERLRKRFTCPANAGPAASAGGSDGAGEGGLSRADAEFLIRFAGECDAVARRLTLAQDYVDSLTR